MNIAFVPFRNEMLADVSAMLARAFLTNPLHVAAFGRDQRSKNEAFFRIGLTVMKGAKHVAVDGGRVVGFIHWVQAPECQFSPAEKAGMLPAMLRGLGLRSSWRASRWLTAWSTHDPGEQHQHLGPIGVDPDAQGRRVGRVLMERYCRDLDTRARTGYLETDRPENVAFYRRFGFEIVAEAPVLGVPNFFMRRAPGS